MNQSGQHFFTFGPFRLNAGEGTLKRDHQSISLTPKEFETLLALVEAEGRVVKKEDLLARVWPDSYVGDGSLARNISVLRKSLGDGVIETLPRRGYRLALPVTVSGRLDMPSETSLSSLKSLPQDDAGRRISMRGVGVALVITFCAVLLGAAIWADRRSRPQTHSGSAQDLTSAWVLVAPFENRTGAALPDDAEATFEAELNHSRYAKPAPADRVHQALSLMRRPPDTVLSPEIAREVCLRDGDMRLLITGQIEKVDAGYVITSNLVNPATGAVLISINEHSEEQSQLTPALRKLAVRTRQAADDQLPQLPQPKSLEKVTTDSLHALELYSSASELLAQNGGESPPAVDMLKEAVEVDPRFLSAQALLARALANLDREEESRPFLGSMFEQASALPDNERYFVLGSYYESMHQPGRAAEQYEALVHLYPDDFWGFQRLAHVYRYNLQRSEAALPYTLRLAELRSSEFLYNHEAWELLQDLQKQPEAAEHYRRRAERLATPQVVEQFPYRSADVLVEPTNQLVINAKPDTALSELQRLADVWESLGPRGRSALANRLALIYAALGRINDAKKWLARAGEGMGYDYAGCNIADAEGDYGRFLYYLRHLDDRDKTNAQVVAVFAQLHDIREAERLFHKLQKQPGFASAEAHWIRGELARARGNLYDATIELRAAVTAFTVSDDAMLHNELPLAAESLADVLEAQGDTTAAISVLEPLASLKLNSYGQFPEYARVLVKLSGLYRGTQRLSEGEKIDTQLRARFADADHDYFVIRYLRGESISASHDHEIASVTSISPY